MSSQATHLVHLAPSWPTDNPAGFAFPIDASPSADASETERLKAGTVERIHAVKPA